MLLVDRVDKVDRLNAKSFLFSIDFPSITNSQESIYSVKSFPPKRKFSYFLLFDKFDKYIMILFPDPAYPK